MNKKSTKGQPQKGSQHIELQTQARRAEGWVTTVRMIRRAWPQQVRPAARGLIATYSDFAVGIAEERDVAVQERDVAVQERDVAAQERDAAVQERDVAVQRELAAQFFASEAQACACGARHQLEQQREKEQRARDWAAAAELRVCLLEQQHLAVQRMADEAERRAREAEEHREAERRMADEAKRRAREAEEHHEAERRMADEEERRVCASLGITLQYSGSELDSSSWRHVADEARRCAKEAERRERRAARSGIYDKPRGPAPGINGIAARWTSYSRQTGKWDYSHIPPTDPHVASIVEAAIKRRLSVFQPSWVTVCPWLVCVALNAELCTSCNGRGCCVCSRLFCTDCVSAQRDNPFTRGSHYFKKETVQNHMRAHHKRRPS